MCVFPRRMSQCAISSTSMIRKGGSQLIKMDTMSSLRAHQITERLFIARLFVITPNWLPRSSLWFGHWTLRPLRKRMMTKEKKRPPTIAPAGWRELKIEISKRKREREIKTFSRCLQSASYCHILGGGWGGVGRPSEELQACFVSGLR